MLGQLLAILPFLFSPSAYAENPCARALNPAQGLLHQTNYSDEDAQDPFRLSPEERLEVLCELRSAVLNRYSEIDIKRERIGLDTETHLNSCIVAELKSKDDTRLGFLERTQKCLAAFQDSHFKAKSPLNPPSVFTAVESSLIRGKVVIVNRRPDLLKKITPQPSANSASLEEILKIGSEIVRVDGVDAEKWIKFYASYLSASTALARNTWAAEHILNRNFLYPLKNTVELTVRDANGKLNTVVLPYWSSANVRNIADANFVLKKIGIPSYREVVFTRDTEKNTWNKTSYPQEGWIVSGSLVPDTMLSAFVTDDEDEDDALRMGEYEEEAGKKFCYLQPLTWNAEKIREEKKTSVDFMTTIQEFLQKCENSKLPLLLDLRSNPGGNSNYAEKMMALLTRKGEVSISGVQAIRASKHELRTFSQYEKNSTLGDDPDNSQSKVQQNQIGLAMLAALKAKKEYSNIVVHAGLSPALDSGFNQKVVTLTSYECASACDKVLALIKTNKRATILGTATNGTGAGYSTVNNMSENFSDSREILKISIPTQLFGAADRSESNATLDYQAYKNLILENKPTQPDVEYSTSIEDLESHGSGWMEKALSLLF